VRVRRNAERARREPPSLACTVSVRVRVSSPVS
jgi:hypothetical protein